MLTMAGRICYIKSVLNSFPIYFLSIFVMPKGVCRLLASIQRKDLWEV
jgi:mannosylglycoprotein endo-beta-mannosidase